MILSGDTVLEIVKSSLQDFYLSYKKYLAFALIYMLFSSFLFVPFISFVFNRVLKAIGTGTLLNGEVYRIGLSSIGFIGMLMISFIMVVILFVEFGVMIMIAQQTYFKRNILVSEAFVTTVRKLPALLGFGMIQLMFIFLMIIPFIDSPVFPTLLDFNVPIILTNELNDMSTFVLALFLCVLILGIFLFTRLIFTLHYIFIEEKSVWYAMKHSWKITKYNKLHIIVNLLMLNFLFSITGFLIMSFLSYIPNLTETIVLSHIIEDYLVAFSSFMTITISLLFIPLNIIITTRLLYRFKQHKGELVENQLTIYDAKKLTSFENSVTHFLNEKKYSSILLIIIYVSSVVIANGTVNDQIVYLKWNVQVAAHRGDVHKAPENSLSSIEAALEQGVDAIEIDVKTTKDGRIILNHDSTLSRVAGVPERVEELNYEELSHVDIGRLFSDEFIGEKIPTLSEALDRLSEENVNVIIDVKLTDLTRSSKMAKSIVDLVKIYGLEDATYVQSFDNEFLQEVRRQDSTIKIGQILFLSAGSLNNLDVDFYTIRQTMLSQRFIDNARELNREVWVWTVNNPRNIKEVLKYDINGIITDYPERVQRMTGF